MKDALSAVGSLYEEWKTLSSEASAWARRMNDWNQKIETLKAQGQRKFDPALLDEWTLLATQGTALNLKIGQLNQEALGIQGLLMEGGGHG
jgi:hypothetical protein